MTRAPGRNCGGCRYWSEMIAQSIGGREVEAMCLSPDGPVMETMPKPAADGLQLALCVALFAACSVNLGLLSFWL